MNEIAEVIDVGSTSSSNGHAVIDALANMPRDLAIIKMNNDSIMSLAAAHPRDYGKVLADLRSQITTFKSFAEDAMYSKPCGKDRDTKKMKYARGLSIRAAEAIAAAYGFNRVDVRQEPIDADRVRITATFTDFQAGRIWSVDSIVSRKYKGFDKVVRTHDDDRFYNVVLKSEASKCIRECITRSVSPGLRSELERLVDEQLDKFLDDNTVKTIIAKFSTKGVTPEMIEAKLGKRMTNLTVEDRKILLGLWNAIKDDETTVTEMFEETTTEVAATKTKERTEKLKQELIDTGGDKTKGDWATKA